MKLLNKKYMKVNGQYIDNSRLLELISQIEPNFDGISFKMPPKTINTLNIKNNKQCQK